MSQINFNKRIKIIFLGIFFAFFLFSVVTPACEALDNTKAKQHHQRIYAELNKKIKTPSSDIKKLTKAQVLTVLNELPDFSVEIIALGSDGTAYIGGTFTMIGNSTRNRLAAIKTDGTLSSWNPNASSPVVALAISGSTIYAGGFFTTIGGVARNRLAAIGTDGTLQSWNPDVNSTVHVLEISGSTIYAGGDFTTIGGVARNRLAAIGTDGTLASWNPNANSSVYTLAISGSTIYAGGAFTTIGGTTRNYLAAIGTDGTLASWNPNANDIVETLAISGSTIYAGGFFTTIGGTTRNRLAAIGTDGTLASWNPDANSSVYALAISGSTIYAGGYFTTIGGVARNRLAAIGTDGTLASWNPNANSQVYTLAISGSTIYAGGTFTTIGGTSNNYFAKFTPSSSASNAVSDSGSFVEGAPTITSPKNGDFLNTTTPTISGTSVGGGTIRVRNNNIVIGVTSSSVIDGNWSFTPSYSLQDDVYNLTATLNNSPASRVVSVTIDTKVPDVPTISTPRNLEIIKKDTRFTGLAEVNSTVEIFVNDKSIGTTSVNKDGIWEFTFPSPFPDVLKNNGEYTFSFSQQDRAGNKSEKINLKLTFENNKTENVETTNENSQETQAESTANNNGEGNGENEIHAGNETLTGVNITSIPTVNPIHSESGQINIFQGSKLGFVFNVNNEALNMLSNSLSNKEIISAIIVDSNGNETNIELDGTHSKSNSGDEYIIFESKTELGSINSGNGFLVLTDNGIPLAKLDISVIEQDSIETKFKPKIDRTILEIKNRNLYIDILGENLNPADSTMNVNEKIKLPLLLLPDAGIEIVQFKVNKKGTILKARFIIKDKNRLSPIVSVNIMNSYGQDIKTLDITSCINKRKCILK